MGNNNNGDISNMLSCEDLLIRIKNEFVSMAMVVLDKEIKRGTIKLNGSIISPTDKNKENEEFLFIINNLIKERESIHKKYDNLLSLPTDNLTSKIVNRTESLKKFLLTIDTIYILINYSNIIDSWIKDVLMDINGDSIEGILKNTINCNIHRIEAFDFIANRNDFIEQKVINELEFTIIKNITKSQIKNNNQQN